MRFIPSVLFVLALTALPNPGRSQAFPGDVLPAEPRLRQLARAESHVSAGELGVAREVLDSVLANDLGASLRVRALVLRARCARTLGDAIAAQNDYDRIIALAPEGIAGVEAARDRGTLAFDHREFQQARDLLNAAVKRGTLLFETADSVRARAAVADAWYWIGKCYTQYDQREEARWALDSADAAYPRNPHGDAAYYERAGLAARDGDLPRAALLYQKIVDVYPHSALLLDARLRQAQCFIDLGNYGAAGDAVAAAQELLDAAPASGNQHSMHVPPDAATQIAYLNGEIASGTSNYVKAGIDFGHALALPHAVVLHRAILFALGWSAYQSGNFSDAVAWFDSVGAQDVPRDEMSDRADLLAARAALRAGHATEGEKRLAVIADNPDHGRTADANLDLALRRVDDSALTDAKKYVDRAIKRGRGTVVQGRAEILRAEMLLTQQQYADAATSHRAATQTLSRVDSSGDSVPALRALARVRLGYALARSGQYREAVPVLNEFLGSFPGHSATREAIFWLAESYYGVNAVQNARDMYLRYLSTPGGPHREEALYGAGWAEFRLRRFAQSKQNFTKLVAEYPRSPFAIDALLREADGQYLIRDFAGAARAYESAATRAGHGERGEYAQFQAAQCFVKLGDRAKAVTTLRAFVAAHPKSALVPEAMYQIGWNLFEQKQYPGAITALRELMAAAPDSGVAAKALYTIGDAQYNSGDYEGALATYDKLVDTYPTSPYVDAALASEQYCLNFLGRDSLAATVVPRFVERHADLPNAHELTFKQGEVFYNSQKYGDAVKEYAAVAKRVGATQDGATATYWMGKSYLNLGDTAKAIEAFRTVVEKFPAVGVTSSAALDLARVHAARGANDNARAAFESLMKKFAGTQDAANGMIDYGEFLLTPAVHDTVRAAAVLNDAANLPPSLEASARAQILLGNVSAARGQTDEAARWYSGVAQRPDGLGAEAQFRLGDAYRGAALYSDAITALLRVKAEFGAYDEWLTRALLSLGASYEAVNQNDLAREAYQTVAAFHRDDDFATEALARIKKLKK